MYRNKGPVLLLLLFLLYSPAQGYTPPTAVDDYSHGYNQIKGLIDSSKNITNYQRISGMISDLLRIQREEFNSRKTPGENIAAIQVEDQINTAGLYASQSDFENCFVSLETALDMVIEALGKLK